MMNFFMSSWGLFFLVYFFSLISFVVNIKYLLSLLLSLECVMMSLFCMIAVSMTLYKMDMYICMIILTFIACEAAVGLSILVNMISAHGSNHVNSMSLMSC